MEPPVYTNKRGFTLIELLVAVVILSVGLLALLQTVNVALAHNAKNMFRNEAIQLADEQMALELSKPFALISTVPPNPSANIKLIPKQVNLVLENYSVVKQGTVVSPNTTRVGVYVSWKYKGQGYSHTITSMLSKINN
jgi:type IV pilus assembly protein PilV